MQLSMNDATMTFYEDHFDLTLHNGIIRKHLNDYLTRDYYDQDKVVGLG